MASHKSSGIPVTDSMFACLKLEDEMEEQKKSKRRRNQQNQNNENDSSNKKKDKKKNANESKQLQQLAFGGKSGSASRKKSGKNQNSSANNSKPQDQNWDEWKQHDKEVIEDQFKQDLEKAILASQLQLEQDKAVEKEKQKLADNGEDIPQTREERKKKKQKDKAKPMSLEEFKQLPAKTPKQTHSDSSDEGEPSPPPVNYRVPTNEQDAKFFHNVSDEAQHIIRQDRMQEEYRKTYAVDNAVVAKLKNDIEVRDKTIVDLKQKVETMEVEMKQVKRRSKRLCEILGQCEMKEKAEILVQVEKLNVVKDDLTEEVIKLKEDVEKEKSKNRTMQVELDKLKASKHGKQ